MGGVLQRLQAFGMGRLAVALGVSLGALALIAALLLRVGGQPQALLYANLDLKEAASITEALDQAGVAYEAKGDGSTIMVNRDEVAATRLKLSSQGLPTSGSVGYEIFDEASVMGQTDFVQQLNRQRALEGELARTIRMLKGVSAARVHLVLPKRQLFEEEPEQPSATIVVGVAGGQLAAENVRALRNLVAGAVPGLKADRVTIIDENNELLASGAEGGAEGLTGALADGTRQQMEARLTSTVRELVEGVVGAGKAKVKVSAELDLNRVTVQEETFDPDGQVVRSTSASEETGRESDREPGDAVSVSNNIPGAINGGETAGTQSETERTEETTNYEISKTQRTEVQEPGRVRRLSVAVAVDGVTAPATDGKSGAYAPRPAEEMQRIEQLVRSAVGYDQARGDQISVVNVKFNRAADGVGGVEAASPLAGFDKNDLMRAGELLVLAIVSALLVLFVIRPLLKGGPGGGLPALSIASAGAGGPAAIGQDPRTGAALAIAGPGAAAFDNARIDGDVSVSGVRRASEFVERHPEQSVSVLRTWLQEG